MQHPRFTRRSFLQAGSIGLLGLGINHLTALRAAGRETPGRAVIFLFLSGGLAQHESFDLKPDAPDSIRGEFQPIATATPGISICEHLPRLATRSNDWALIRSLTHPSNDHSAGHHIMLTGRSQIPPGFNPSKPMPTDHPSIAAVATATLPVRNNLPPAVVLPDRIVHNSGRVIPGQFAGVMGSRYEPWFLEASAFEPRAYGAYPEYEFDHQERTYEPKRRGFILPNLSLPEGLSAERLKDRVGLLARLDSQRAGLEAGAESFDRHHQAAVSLLTSGRVRRAFDLDQVDARTKARYGDNAFGWSLLMARRLVEAGVGLVQVNVGNNETWDTHGNAFPHLREKLLPPLDRSLSALLDDLRDSGLLESTLLVMAGEFGRTPKISTLTQFYKGPGRDHWGSVQSVWLAGGGVRGGNVVGASDKTGGYPAREPQTPENLAATMYHVLGLPRTLHWHDAEQRPHAVYHGEPIARLF
jgi:hypothetical protein